MPIISMFYGIIIRMYLLDNKHHNLPHIHAKYAEFEASINISDGEILAVELPRKPESAPCARRVPWTRGAWTASAASRPGWGWPSETRRAPRSTARPVPPPEKSRWRSHIPPNHLEPASARLAQQYPARRKGRPPRVFRGWRLRAAIRPRQSCRRGIPTSLGSVCCRRRVEWPESDRANRGRGGRQSFSCEAMVATRAQG